MFSSPTKTIINTVFIGALLIPPAAAILSPQFRTFASAVIANPASIPVQKEALRRATPLWSDGISLYNTALYYIGVSPNPNVMAMGKDGYMFLGNDHVKAYDQVTRRLNPPQSEIEAWVNTFEYERNYLKQRGIPMLFVVAPSTGTVYADKLAHVPAGFAGNPTLFDRVLKLTKERGLPLLDVRADLIEGRKTAETYSKLNSHWSDFGAYVAWQKIAPEIEKIMPGQKLAGVGDKIRVETVNSGNEAEGLLNIHVPNDWTRPVREQPFPNYNVIMSDGAQRSVSGETLTGFLELPRETVSPNATSSLRTLVLTDSMGASLSPYWTASFKELLQVNHHVRLPPEKLDFEGTVEKFKPDFVFYLMTERYFTVPLGDLDAFKAQAAFTTTPELATDALWSAGSAQNAVAFASDTTLSQPSTAKLPDGGQTKRYVQIIVNGEGAGSLYVSYQVAGVTTEGWHEFTAGETKIWIPVPERFDNDTIWLLRDTKRAAATLTNIRVRSASTEG
jgi:hypothetical protein